VNGQWQRTKCWYSRLGTNAIQSHSFYSSFALNVKGLDMATNLDDLVNMKGVLLAFEFTPDGTCTSYKNVTREMAAMICRFCAAVTMNFNALASGFTELSEQQWIPQKGWIYVGGTHTVIMGKGGRRGVFADSAQVSIDGVFAALDGPD
jgi:roadblock/LC7 domain-containing protein